jgi:hypothetical protein
MLNYFYQVQEFLMIEFLKIILLIYLMINIIFLNYQDVLIMRNQFDLNDYFLKIRSLNLMENLIDLLIQDDYNQNKIHVNDLNVLKILIVFHLIIHYFVNLKFQVVMIYIQIYFHQLFQYHYMINQVQLMNLMEQLLLLMVENLNDEFYFYLKLKFLIFLMMILMEYLNILNDFLINLIVLYAEID